MRAQYIHSIQCNTHWSKHAAAHVAHTLSRVNTLKQCSLLSKNIKACNCCFWGSFQTPGREQDFVWTNKGNLLPPLLLPPLNPIMCHHVSPTRLFLSYRQDQLPIPLNCLLCKVTAEERRWERAVLVFSWSSVSATLLRRDSTWELYCTPQGNYTVVLTWSDTSETNLETCFIKRNITQMFLWHFFLEK